MAMMDLECSINSIDKAEAEFERTGSKFERSSTVGNMLQHCILQKLFMKKESIFVAHVIVVLL